VSQYEGSLASSLQTLIQQLSGGGSANPATANLTASFGNLLQGLSGVSAGAASASGKASATDTTSSTYAALASASSGAAGTSGSTGASNTSLQSFLNNLLHNIQNNGVQSFSSLGSHINANV
jgi:hypothetical protein